MNRLGGRACYYTYLVVVLKREREERERRGEEEEREGGEGSRGGRGERRGENEREGREKQIMIYTLGRQSPPSLSL